MSRKLTFLLHSIMYYELFYNVGVDTADNVAVYMPGDKKNNQFILNHVNIKMQPIWNSVKVYIIVHQITVCHSAIVGGLVLLQCICVCFAYSKISHLVLPLLLQERFVICMLHLEHLYEMLWEDNQVIHITRTYATANVCMPCCYSGLNACVQYQFYAAHEGWWLDVIVQELYPHKHGLGSQHWPGIVSLCLLQYAQRDGHRI